MSPPNQPPQQNGHANDGNGVLLREPVAQLRSFG
jgi:hypothetical protein